MKNQGTDLYGFADPNFKLDTRRCELWQNIAPMAEADQRRSPRPYALLIERYIEKYLPASISELGADAVRYYQKLLLPTVTAAFREEVATYDERESFEPWLATLVKRVAHERLATIIRNGELGDEELIRLYRLGIEPALKKLFHRWLPRIKGFVASTVNARNVCPPSTDKDAFIEDVSQEVGIKVLENHSQYKFMKPFEHWIRKICFNTAYQKRREIVRRLSSGDAEYVSWDDLRELGSEPSLQNIDHIRIVRDLLENHGSGRRAEKSKKAIRLRYFNDIPTEEVADRIGLSYDSLGQLFSHDYKSMRKRCKDEHGFSGADL
jgi:RNA polymerase sigma factor (sigma-70 family)